MLSDYLPIAIMFVAAVFIACLVVLISILFGPRKRSKYAAKIVPYESGMRAIGPGQRRYPVRFYLVAVLFILFDIEIVFFYPWAVAFRVLGLDGFFAMLSFIVILLVGYIWVWKKGALEWETSDK